MRKLSILAFIAMFVTSCTNTEFEDVKMVDNSAPEAITLSLEDDATRVELQDGRTTVWSKGDCVSVFAMSDANAKYEYRGETGATTATFYKVAAGSGSKSMNETYTLYPYNEQNSVNTANGTITTAIPTQQNYAKNSFGVGSSVMVATGATDKVLLRNACGWLKIQLTGNGEVVKSISIKGNDGEVIAGEIVVNPADATLRANDDSASLAYKVTLSSTDGVKLSKSATPFYIALRPQTFEMGFAIEVSCEDGTKMMQTTYNTIEVKRNVIQPMAAFEYQRSTPANNELWYMTTDNEKLDIDSSDFDATIASHTFEEVCVNNLCMQMWVVKFDKNVTKIKTNAFKGFITLKQVNMPNSIEVIGSMAFYDCSVLRNVTLSDSLTTIEQGAFGNCANLAEITIPEGVTKIGGYAFAYCSNLSVAYVKPTTPPTLGSDVFYHYVENVYEPIGTKLYVPEASYDSYVAAKRWSTYKKYFKRYDFDNDLPVDADTPEEEEPTVKKFHHRILLIDHTRTWCGNCPRVMDGLVALAETDCHNYYNEVTCHGSSSSDNAYSTAAYYVDSFYNPNGYPNVRFNFWGAEGNIGDVSSFVTNNTAIINGYAKKTGANAGVKATVKAGTSSVNVSFSVMSAKEQEYKVTAWLLENDVYNPYQSGASNSTYHIYHDHCLRNIGGAYSSSDISGDSLGVIKEGESKDGSFDISVNSGWNINNMEVLIIVSAETSISGRFEVVNTVLCPINSSVDYEYVE